VWFFFERVVAHGEGPGIEKDLRGGLQLARFVPLLFETFAF
jgi:hypothetical protein